MRHAQPIFSPRFPSGDHGPHRTRNRPVERAARTTLRRRNGPRPAVAGSGANLSGGDGGTAATSGGGGGPSGITGYTARVATAATKTNTPLIETPQSVSVVTREALNDRNVQTFAEAVAYVPGAISARSGYDPRFDQIFIRGFDVLTNQGLYRDGLRIIAAASLIQRPSPTAWRR